MQINVMETAECPPKPVLTLSTWLDSIDESPPHMCDHMTKFSKIQPEKVRSSISIEPESYDSALTSTTVIFLLGN